MYLPARVFPGTSIKNADAPGGYQNAGEENREGFAKPDNET
ncbi:MAG: hypothetical protein WC379_10320 [Methanoregula sp.]